MSSDRDSSSTDSSDEDMLPDEREAIAERLDSLEDDESHLTVAEVAEELGIDVDGDAE